MRRDSGSPPSSSVDIVVAVPLISAATPWCNPVPLLVDAILHRLIKRPEPESVAGHVAPEGHGQVHAENPEKVDRVYELDLVDGEAEICLPNVIPELLSLNQRTHIFDEFDALSFSAAISVVYLDVNLVALPSASILCTRMRNRRAARQAARRMLRCVRESE